MKSFCVTEADVIASENNIQPLLQVLKNKGAPIKGVFYLQVEKGYKITSFKCDYCFDRIYIFERENIK